MRFLADENVYRGVVEGLRAEGWEVGWVREDCRGADDAVVAARAQREGLILITSDVHLAGELLKSQGEPGFGVLHLRCGSLSSKVVVKLIREHLLSEPVLEGVQTTLEPGRVRSRPLIPPVL